jgi:hypothetical protein
MTMIKSNFHNLFSYIFPDESQLPSLLIKFLLVLETEKLIPLFHTSDDIDKSIQKGITALVITQKNQKLLVSNIIYQCLGKNQSSLFFGSNFRIKSVSNAQLEAKIFDSFLIFTLEGLILESPPFLSNQSEEKYNLILWDYWDNVSLTFAKNEPKCSLIFSKNNGEYLAINNISNSHREVAIIEQQLPLIFCYFVMKRFWKYVQESRNESFFLFNSQDFLYLDQDNLSYFTNSILPNINITPNDLDNLVRKI